MYWLHQWVILNEFAALKKKDRVLYDQASDGGNFVGNQGSIPSRSENRQSQKLSSSTKTKTLKLVAKSVTF